MERSLLTIHNTNSRLMTRFFDDRFRDEKCPISSTQYDFLRLIDNHSPSHSLMDLSKAIGMDRSTLTRRARALIQTGHINLRNVNSKEKVLEVTELGKQIITQYLSTYREANERAKHEVKVYQ